MRSKSISYALELAEPVSEHRTIEVVKMTSEAKKEQHALNKHYIAMAERYQNEVDEIEKAQKELNSKDDFVQYEQLDARREQLVTGIMACLAAIKQ